MNKYTNGVDFGRDSVRTNVINSEKRKVIGNGILKYKRLSRVCRARRKNSIIFILS